MNRSDRTLGQELGQTLLEYTLVLLLVTSVFFNFYQRYKERIIGDDSFFSVLLDGIEFDQGEGNAKYRRFRIYR